VEQRIPRRQEWRVSRKPLKDEGLDLRGSAGDRRCVMGPQLVALESAGQHADIRRRASRSIGGHPVTTPLKRLPDFPAKARKTLESRYGIDTAEEFFAHAVIDPEGMRKALEVSQADLDGLTRIAEIQGQLSQEFMERVRRPLDKHPRGLAVDLE
jgi:hypothetical protein